MADTQRDDGSGLVEMEGTVTLCRPPLNDLGCLLSELLPDGCRVMAMLQYLPPDAAAQWRKSLVPTALLRVKFESHSGLGDLDVASQVITVADTPQHRSVELRFRQLTAEQIALLRKVTGKSAPLSAADADRLAAESRAAMPAVQAPEQTPAAAPPPEPQRPAPPPPPPLPLPPAPVPPPAPFAATPVASGPSRFSAARHALMASAPPPPPDVPGAMGTESASSPTLLPVAPAGAPAPAAAPAWPAPRPPPQPAAAKSAGSAGGKQRRRIGEVLVHMGKLNTQQAEEAAHSARASGEQLGRYLVRNRRISPSALCRALALQSGLPMTDLEEATIPDSLLKVFPPTVMMRYGFVPFDDAGTFVCIAAASPLPSSVLKELEHHAHRKVEIFLAREDLILQKLQSFHRPRAEPAPRKHLRYDASLPVTYQFCTRFGGSADTNTYQGMTENVSEGGFSLEGPAINVESPQELIRIGMCLKLTVGPGSALETKSLCRLKTIHVKGPFWEMGVEIVEASTEDRRRLKELCVQAMLKQVTK